MFGPGFRADTPNPKGADMPDPTPQAGNPAGQEPTGQQQQSTQQPAAGATGDQASSTRSAADYEREVKELRAEAASHRTKAREFEDKLKAYDTEKMTETEKLQKRAQEAEQKAADADNRVKQTNLRLEIERQARKLNIVDEDAAARLLDSDAIKFGDDGKPTNVEKLLQQLVKDKPYLVGTSGDGGSAGNPDRGRSGLTIEQIKKMSRAEIDARYDEVMRVVRGG